MRLTNLYYPGDLMSLVVTISRSYAVSLMSNHKTSLRTAFKPNSVQIRLVNIMFKLCFTGLPICWYSVDFWYLIRLDFKW